LFSAFHGPTSPTHITNYKIFTTSPLEGSSKIDKVFAKQARF